MLEELEAVELDEWQEYYRLEPWSDDLFDENFRWGSLLSILENAHFRTKSGAALDRKASDWFPLEPSDLVIERRIPTNEEMLGQLKKMALIFGGKLEIDPEWQTQLDQQQSSSS